MSLPFQKADALFRADNFNELSEDPNGQRYLKLRSLSRTEYLEKLLIATGNLDPELGSRELFKAAFESPITSSEINSFIKKGFSEERKIRLKNESKLINELYKLNDFNWGGLHQNSLEKTIVDNYVKKITDYDELSNCIKKELLTSLHGYVMCSWYNHWTSIVIEDLFKEHKNVLPAIGLVKKIDFFIHDVPFDLKVTYLPEGYLSEKRRARSLRPESTLLKQAARANSIPFSVDLSASALLQDLWLKVSDHPSKHCKELISELRDFRNSVCSSFAKDPTELIKWLYENQGDRRFDSANRLFLILVDQVSFFDSWKLKRAKPLIASEVNAFLDKIGKNPGQKITFKWEGNSYSTIAAAVTIIHKRT